MSKKTEPTAFELIMLGLEQAIAHVNGKLDAKVTRFEIPATPPLVDAEAIHALRQTTNLPVCTFARIFSVSVKTIEAWEAGSRKPTKPQRRLLQLFVEEPATMCKVVGIAPIVLEGFTTVTDEQGQRRIVHEPTGNGAVSSSASSTRSQA